MMKLPLLYFHFKKVNHTDKFEMTEDELAFTVKNK